jgi:hypothetical protein
LNEPFTVPSRHGIPAQLGLDEASLHDAVRAAKDALGLHSVQCSTDGVFVTVHRSSAGDARVAFLINPSTRALRAELSLPGVERASDALDGSEFRARTGLLEVPLPPQTVRMLELFA